MGILANMVIGYLTDTPSEQLSKDWEELKPYNAQGPDILDVISNYERETGSILIESPLSPSDENSQEIIDDGFTKTYTSSNSLWLAA